MLEQQLAIGGVYRFTFKPEFARHGVCSGDQKCLHAGGGVFKVQQICTYVEIFQSSINLFSNFFEPLGYSQEEYEAYYQGKPEDRYTPELTSKKVTSEYYTTDEATNERVKVQRTIFKAVETGKSVRTRKYLESVAYGYNPIYKLIDVEDPDDILYAPEKTILGMPEVNIKEYQNMTIAVGVGFWDKPELLDGLIMNIREKLALYGIAPENVQAFSADSKWMSIPEYEDEAAKRNKRIGEIVEITEDTKENYLNSNVVENGEIFVLKDDSVEGSSIGDGEMPLSSVIASDIILDYTKFITPSSDEIFDGSKEYYLFDTSTRVYTKLIKGVDYGPEDATVIYREATEEEKSDSSVQKYRDDGEDFAEVLNNSIAQRYLEEGVKLYKKVEEVVSGETSVSYTEVESVSDDNDDVLYVLMSKHTWVKDNSGDYVRILSEEIELYEIDYTNENAVSLLGKRFKYATRYNTEMTVDITPEVLVGLSAEAEVPGIRITASLATRYERRWFEYTDTDGKTKAIVLTANKEVKNSDNNLALGSILGITGKTWKRIVVANGDVTRSYLKLYHDEVMKNRRLMAKCEALEAALLDKPL